MLRLSLSCVQNFKTFYRTVLGAAIDSHGGIIIIIIIIIIGKKTYKHNSVLRSFAAWPLIKAASSIVVAKQTVRQARIGRVNRRGRARRAALSGRGRFRAERPRIGGDARSAPVRRLCRRFRRPVAGESRCQSLQK